MVKLETVDIRIGLSKKGTERWFCVTKQQYRYAVREKMVHEPGKRDEVILLQGRWSDRRCTSR